MRTPAPVEPPARADRGRMNRGVTASVKTLWSLPLGMRRMLVPVGRTGISMGESRPAIRQDTAYCRNWIIIPLLKMPDVAPGRSTRRSFPGWVTVGSPRGNLGPQNASCEEIPLFEKSRWPAANMRSQTGERASPSSNVQGFSMTVWWGRSRFLSLVSHPCL